MSWSCSARNSWALGWPGQLQSLQMLRRGAATLQLASREGGGAERGREGGRNDAAGQAPMRAAAGLTARQETDVTDTESESEVPPRGRSARIAGTVATAERAHGVASRTRRRSAGPERNSGARPRLARRVIIHRAPNGAPLCARLSPDNRGEGFIALDDTGHQKTRCFYVFDSQCWVQGARGVFV
jgi:hypothetical protein